MSVFLTEQEVRELTGSRVKNKQAKALLTMGIIYTTRPDNSVVIYRNHIEQKLCEVQKPKKERTEPDWEALRNVQKASKNQPAFA
jgi:hypothetical protein